jgi:hypothetical protein
MFRRTTRNRWNLIIRLYRGAGDAARREQTNASANKQVTHVVLGKCGRTRQHAQSHEI